MNTFEKEPTMPLRFDLEEKLYDCWKITEDIGTVLKATDGDLSLDDLQNALIGLKTVYNMKFQQTWDIFEKMIETGEIRLHR